MTDPGMDTDAWQLTGGARIPAPSVARRLLQWRRAWRALCEVIADPERTDQVVEFINVVGGAGDERAYARFRAHPNGQRLLAERPSLLAALSQLDRLRRLPAGSFGRAYADFMRDERLDPDGVVKEFKAADWDAIDPDREWFFERIDVAHDLWHVLTGYGRDEAGEAANLAFTYAQVPARGVGLLVLAAVAVGPKDPWLRWPRYLLRAWHRGRRAAWLPLAAYEPLLPEPLDEVRRQLGIESPAVAHPAGIVVGSAMSRRPRGMTRPPFRSETRR